MSEPIWKQGKICYLILPSKSVDASAEFYRSVFGWTVRKHDNGDTAFDDATGMVSGMWNTHLEPRAGGYEVDIWVDSVAATAALIVEAGGELVGDLQLFSEKEQYQQFIDPDGNHMGIYHHDE